VLNQLTAAVHAVAESGRNGRKKGREDGFFALHAYFDSLRESRYASAWIAPNSRPTGQQKKDKPQWERLKSLKRI
jgi:hypothetical protein